MNAEKIVQLNQNVVYDEIQSFLKRKKNQSEQTYRAYKSDIKKFFKIVKDKDFQFLNEKDINLTLDDFEYFVDERIEKVSNKTINRQVTAVKGLLEYLHAKGELVNNISYFSLIERLPENKNEWDVLTVDEALKMAQLAKETEHELADVKQLYILFALDTCMRKQAILNLTWKDFRVKDDHVLVRAIDKGNKDYRPKISKEFYEELKGIKRKGEERVFPMSLITVNRMFPRLRDKLGIDDNRQIVFHSLRKSGVTYQFRMTGDIYQAMKAANHSNVNTTMAYIEEQDYGIVGAYSSMKKLNIEEVIKNADPEQLKEIILKECNKSIQISIAQKLENVNEKSLKIKRN